MSLNTPPSMSILSLRLHAIGSLGFPLSLRMLRQFQVATACFSCNPPDFNSSELDSFLWKPPNYATQSANSAAIFYSGSELTRVKLVYEHQG
jgi:hypothetical protein